MRATLTRATLLNRCLNPRDVSVREACGARPCGRHRVQLQSRTPRLAFRGKTQALGSELAEIRRDARHLTIQEVHGLIAEVVGSDEQDVERRLGGVKCDERCEQQGSEKGVFYRCFFRLGRCFT